MAAQDIKITRCPPAFCAVSSAEVSQADRDAIRAYENEMAEKRAGKKSLKFGFGRGRKKQ